ncbi:hypothetical protein DdX_11157 [Ditylenchus destructor]|uniref:Uncharacterized protein n=1 Tax=Ditylenchus destructor TaxID=166010 RepID=A0AAD4MWU8_9BILA|nr:hypothetical protein DdX_11157 [Ditylenchus destructor]
MTFVLYLTLVENIIAILCQFIAIILWLNILHANFFRKNRLRCKIANSMLLFLVCHTLFSISDLPYRIYTIVQWQDVTAYPYLAYWVMIPDGNYFAIAPCFLLFLTIDRLLVLKLTYTLTVRKIFFYATIFFIISLVTASTIIFILELPLDIEIAKSCSVISCMVTKSKGFPQLVSRMTFNTLNLLSSFLFFYLLPATGRTRQNNRVVMFSILCEILLNIIPGYFNLAFNSITGKHSAAYFGEYTKMFCMIDTACCAFYYSYAFLKRKHCAKISLTPQLFSSSENMRSQFVFNRTYT